MAKKKMSYIVVNDIFDELSDENKRLKQCLNVLIKFKTFFGSVFDNLKTSLESNDLQEFQNLDKQIKEVFENNCIPLRVSTRNETIDDNIITETNEVFIESNVSKIKRYKRKYVCDLNDCQKPLRTIRLFKKHMRSHGITHHYYSCDFIGCNFGCNSKGFFMDHLNKHKGVKPHKCSSCDQSFTAKEYLNRHFNIYHKISDQIYICDIEDCNKEFRTELSFKIHQQKSHLDSNKFKCDQQNCNFSTATEKRLFWHKSAKHLNYRPFKCQIDGCLKSFVNKGQLTLHNYSHNLENTFKCSHKECDKTFRNVYNLNKHLRTIHTGKKLVCEWPGCDYRTGLKASLVMHSKVHSSEYDFVCDWPECGKRFKLKKYLRNHLRIHNSDKRYACHWPGCQYRCTDDGNITKHRKIHEKSFKVFTNK